MSDQAVRTGRTIATTHAQDQRNSIPYRPQYTRITGKVAASILLQQISYWSHIKKGKPFYKFRAPCAHEWYKEGDSWTEELGMTPGGFDTALKAIGAKVTKGKSKSELLKTNLVIYWTDNSRVTWYQLNEGLFYRVLELAYQEPELLGKSGFRNWLGKHETAKILYSETTPETTTKHVATATRAPAGATEETQPLSSSSTVFTESTEKYNCRICFRFTHIDEFGVCGTCNDELERGVLCSDCEKYVATSVKMPYIAKACTCQSEKVLADEFGPRPPREERKPPKHWTEQAAEPWASWGAESDEFQRQLERFGDSGRIVQELGYKLEEATGLHPLWGTPKKVKWWSSGLWELYEEAGYSIPVAIEAARALKANKKMTPVSPYSFHGTARAIVADGVAPPVASSGMGAGIAYS